MNISVIVTDIEGTTSSIEFVHDILFPYASRALPEFVHECCDHPVIAALVDDVRHEAEEADASVDRVVEILQNWIDADRKVTALKELQGHVWRRGYERGDFTGHIFDDAADRLRRWSKEGVDLYVYSSGSVDAQKLLFGYSDAGDLRPVFKGYFDTRIGHKREVSSYLAIAEAIDKPAREILFLSDIVEELDAAAEAGMQTVQLVREENVVVGTHTVAKSFDDIMLN